jgi:hypothetical protein
MVDSTCQACESIALGLIGYEMTELLDGMESHPFDWEHSEVLVAAPTPYHNVYNPNPYAYMGYEWYAASHEGTMADHSSYAYSLTGEQGHIPLYLSLGKHGTYFFDPDELMLTPDYIMYAGYEALWELYINGLISYYTYEDLCFALDVLFGSCIVEHFNYPYYGGAFAYPRIETGEPVEGQILNECGFIMDPRIYEKMQMWIFPYFLDSGQIFIDVPPEYFLFNYINAVYDAGYTYGCSQIPLAFCPQGTVTRGDGAAWTIRALYGENFSYTTAPYFSDVPPEHWAFKYIQKLKDVGITTSVGTFSADSGLTRGMLATLIIRAKYGENFYYTTTPYFNDVPPEHWAFKYVQKFREFRVFSG